MGAEYLLSRSETYNQQLNTATPDGKYQIALAAEKEIKD